MSNDPDPLAGIDPLGHHDSAPAAPGSHHWHVELTQRQINALLAHARLVAAQIAELTSRIVKVEAQQAEADERVRQLRMDMAENTAITKQIRDIITAGRVAKQGVEGLGWLGGMAVKIGVGAAAIYGALQALLHVKGPPP